MTRKMTTLAVIGALCLFLLASILGLLYLQNTAHRSYSVQVASDAHNIANGTIMSPSQSTRFHSRLAFIVGVTASSILVLLVLAVAIVAYNAPLQTAFQPDSVAVPTLQAEHPIHDGPEDEATWIDLWTAHQAYIMSIGGTILVGAVVLAVSYRIIFVGAEKATSKSFKAPPALRQIQFTRPEIPAMSSAQVHIPLADRQRPSLEQMQTIITNAIIENLVPEDKADIAVLHTVAYAIIDACREDVIASVHAILDIIDDKEHNSINFDDFQTVYGKTPQALIVNDNASLGDRLASKNAAGSADQEAAKEVNTRILKRMVAAADANVLHRFFRHLIHRLYHLKYDRVRTAVQSLSEPLLKYMYDLIVPATL